MAKQFFREGNSVYLQEGAYNDVFIIGAGASFDSVNTATRRSTMAEKAVHLAPGAQGWKAGLAGCVLLNTFWGMFTNRIQSGASCEGMGIDKIQLPTWKTPARASTALHLASWESGRNV
jgi:hypothetical protein